MLKTPKTWLLAGAALTLCAGVAVASADPAEAIRQAQADARVAQVDAARMQADAQKAREDAVRVRADARKARDEARAAWRDHDRVYYRGASRSEMLSDALQLRPDQKPALDAFLEATKPTHGRDLVRFDHRTDETRTTLQRLDEMSARAAEQKAETDRRIAAVRTFYGQLDASQKKALDALPMLMMVGPNIGPMMIPRIAYGPPPLPPVPPVPPAPPIPPRS